MSFDRASGILLHPTSLPSRGGIGDLGPAAYEFVEFLTSAGQSLWQVLPLGPLGYGNSPYSATSAFAGSPLLISLERLAERGWIESAKVNSLPDGVAAVDYDRVRATKLPLLFEAASNFLSQSSAGNHERFRRFCGDQAWWLEDFVLFDSLRELHGSTTWTSWPQGLVRREPDALNEARSRLGRELDLRRAIQFAFFEQWRALHRRCRELGIRIIGDVAIFISFDSADVWTHPDMFYVDHDLQPQFVAGVPPDAFSETGQRWGNPVYRWDILRARGYDWWVQRMRWALETCDIVRLDHFRGFEKYWEIPASEATAVHGRWVEGPADDLFRVLQRELGKLPFIAEDLGFITPEVHALRRRLDIPGMRVMQFGFGNPGAHIYLPHRFEPNTVVYTGTHDNDTIVGWWRSWATEQEREAVAAYLGADGAAINWAFIRAAETSVADLCVIPLQDVLGLDSEARMNVPSRADGNWAWRCARGALHPEAAANLRSLAEVCDRLPRASASGEKGHREAAEEFAA